MSEWYDELPERWETHKASELFAERREKVSDTDYAPLSVSKGGVVPQIATVAKSNAGDNRKLVRKDDFVINSRSDRRGSSGLSDYDGSVSLINIVLTPRNETNGKYWHYLLRSHNFIEEYYRNGRGIVADLWTTRYDEFKTISLPLPPRDEQDQIVRFLDWKVSQINRLINAKKKQIALLQEQRQAYINVAVTKSDTGWQDISLGNLGSFRKGFGGSRADDVESGGVACIRYGDIYRTGSLFLHNAITRITEESSNTYARVYKSEMLFALSGETKEEIGQALVNCIKEDTWTSGDAAIFTANESVLPEFLAYALRCPYLIQQKAALAKGDIIVHISTGALRQLRILLPTDIDVQKEIVAKLDKVSEATAKAIELESEQITLLYEYRTRLISDVVTGKIDVLNYVAIEEVSIGTDCVEDTEEGGELGDE